jgi:hypothetical protein
MQKTHSLQSIQACVQAKLSASFIKDVTEVFARCCLDGNPTCCSVDDYHV